MTVYNVIKEKSIQNIITGGLALGWRSRELLDLLDDWGERKKEAKGGGGGRGGRGDRLNGLVEKKVIV